MGKKGDPEEFRELKLLEALEEEPEARQVDLAARLGMAVGTVNWLLTVLRVDGRELFLEWPNQPQPGLGRLSTRNGDTSNEMRTESKVWKRTT